MKKILSLLLALTMALIASVCAAEGNATADALIIAVTKDENSLTPFTYVSATGTTVNRLIYDTLFTTDLDNNVVPWMVEDDYEVSNGYKSYTFTLIDGQRFHDGAPVTTADVEFSFTYPGTQNVSGQRKICGKIESFDIIDDRTMTINLIEPDINFLRSGLASLRIISKAQYENVEDATTVNETIGSGMYCLKEYKTGQYYVLEAVQDYFKGTPKVKTINMPIMEDATAVQSALLSGELAAATSSVSVEMLDVFRSAPGIELFASAGYAPMIMNINNGIAPLNDTRFRNALTYAIDVNGIMRTLYGDYATVGTKGIIRPDMPYSVEGLEYVYDVDRANSILDEAGYAERTETGVRLTPDGEPCSFEILVYSGNTNRIRTAELIAGQLQAVGIGLTVKVMEMDTVDAYVWPDFEVSKGRDYDFSMWGWGSSINPDFLAGLFSSDFSVGNSNVCGYVNADVDKVIAGQYKNVATDEELYAALREIQNLVAEDPGLICFGFADSLQACNTDQYAGFKAGKGTNVINIYSFID